MALPRSPLAPESACRLPAIDGVRLATRACGIKYRGRSDVCLMAFDPGTAVAGVFTRSKTASAPVDWCRRALAGGRARAVLVNSGNANAFTGRLGEDSTAAIAQTFLDAYPNEAPNRPDIADRAYNTNSLQSINTEVANLQLLQRSQRVEVLGV